MFGKVPAMESASDADIRLLTAADLGGALTLSTTAGWNQRLADWRMLLQLAPAGSFVALSADRIVGTAIGIDYGAFAWVAMMLVDPSYRGQGLGARLLEAAIGAVPRDHPVRLDATPMGRPLYQRFGFADEATLTRHTADASRPPFLNDAVTCGIRSLSAADVRAFTGIDAGVFGANRRILLEWALGGAPEYAHAIETGGTLGYGFGRPGRLFHQIGPVIAPGEPEARALVAAAVTAAAGHDVVADVFDAQTSFAGWLRGCGFVAQRPLFRMCRGPLPEPRRTPGHQEYAIFGPEFA